MAALSATAPPDSDALYAVRRSSRARHLQAVVRAGRIEVVVPRWARPGHVEAFVRGARPWMLEQAARLAAGEGAILPAACAPGARVLYEGRPRALAIEPDETGPRVDLGEQITVRLPAAAAADREPLARATLQAWLEERARLTATALVARHAPRLGAAPTALRIKAQKTLWGSCGRRGAIHLNWRLIGAPPEVFEYIVVHELCHLKERNHGPRFWRLVGGLVPDYERHRSWLRANGSLLG
ncbi:MAG: M48 family metallopeptidase [Acidobacteriota bacterium]|nr:M48 family metallopeptidase [Acidobacteriota bacterium]MDH3522752.1 M48 family metallopeptidase [Acidobacteriota bacterium]